MRRPLGIKKQKATKSKKATQRLLRQTWAMLLAVATLISVPAAVFTFYPRMTVSPSGLFDDSNAYTETFTISNIGFLSFQNVSVGIGICSIKTVDGSFSVYPNGCPNDTAHLLISGGPSWDTPEIRQDEPFSIVLSDALNIPTEKYSAEHPNVIGGFQMMSALKAANIIVVVHFEPWPFSWELQRNFRFVAEEQPNRKIMWRAVPLSWRDIKLPLSRD